MTSPAPALPHAVCNVLFLCTGNSARSILGEAILNRIGEGHFRAFSAGSHPRGEVHPLARDVLSARGHDLSGLRSKSWAEFEGSGAPRLDIILTVCDDAAAETCPVWPGHPVTVHWGIPDPARADGSGAERRRAFEDAHATLSARIAKLVALPIAGLGAEELKAALAAIAKD